MLHYMHIVRTLHVHVYYMYVQHICTCTLHVTLHKETRFMFTKWRHFTTTGDSIYLYKIVNEIIHAKRIAVRFIYSE